MVLALAVAIVLSSAALGLGAGMNAAPLSSTDVTRVPHYFGPYSNWANSPQVLPDAIVTITPAPPAPTAVGNPLIARTDATDSDATVFGVVAGSPLPAGTLSDFQIWNQPGAPGSFTTPPRPASAGNVFHAYVLRPTGAAGEYIVAFDSGPLTVPTGSNPVGEVATFPVAPFVVQAGDLIGWYGRGIPLDTGVGTDVIASPGPATAPVAADTITLGSGGFPTVPQARAYSIAATVTPNAVDPGSLAEATATVDPKTGGIAAVTITSPGSGYLIAPTVTITSAVATPTPAAATAVISQGVIASIAVVESGFGFTAPTVDLSGGNPTTPATAIASGGVDFVTLTSGGNGYAIQPIVEFSLPNLPGGSQATGTATMDATGVVTAVDVVNPGSGYTSAPTVTILDGDQVNPTAATAEATIGVAQIDVTSGGQGYDSAPAVTISDTVGTPDKGATAAATVAVKGAVTSINITNPGAGYLTPGLRKFVDTLPGLGPTGVNNLGQYIPVAVPDTTTYPGTDYYEIAVVQYREQMHSDLPATLLRGYVQLSTSVVPGKQVALANADLEGGSTPIAGYLGVDNPHYLGPTIVATKNRPVRILFRNLLPTGVAGNLFLPVDTSLMGSGPGPDMMTLDAEGVPMDMAMDEGTVTDGVRNPACGEIPKPAECYEENRATLHLHGGITPWISDGTPYQWITPAGEDAMYPKGVSVSNVPDMPDPGEGAQTFFYTNQQGARLMFYHDHSWGITRLNVYAGEAAPYLISDDAEKKLIADGTIPGAAATIPLVIQDKTFVPTNIAATDPTWQADRWGGTGNLWLPHVYMPAQNPGDSSGMSAFGRWMYGPWFWPPAKDAKYPPIENPYYDPTCDAEVEPFCEPELIPSTPNVSVGMEAFNDTPVVNGTAYPTTTVDPKAYRYRILNAANDRFWNLSWYVADPTTGTLSEVALNPVELAAAQTDPVVFPTPDTTKSPKGPNWVQIATEGGFLPAPVVVPAQPTTWITDPTRFDVGNVDQHSLLLAPAERADVIVDFSQFRGKTLILYNDAPAAFPARVPGYDYYTGGPDLAPAGAPTTLPGYGPNTRTIMQVKVSSASPATAFDRPNTTEDGLGRLQTAFAHHADGSGVFESAMDPIIVGQAAYNSAYYDAGAPASTKFRAAAPRDGFARIADFSLEFNTLLRPNGSDETLTLPFENKGIHDEMNSASFDEWGRMTANMGLEAPGPTPLLQNIILYPFVNPSTENLDSTGLPNGLHVTPIASETDGTQIWKITHNGVDTHPLHFHLYDVQVINRVTWDNIIIPPDATELGWKDTVRVSPLEDTIVAVRPIVPALPFGVLDSSRPLNPMMPLGARGSVAGQVGGLGTEAGFNNTNTLGNPIPPIVNDVVSFGWEYVWHCHILSHEEMDMMRPVTVIAASEPPDAPVLSISRGSVILTWTDGTPVATVAGATWGDPENEVGYRIERAEVAGDDAGAYTQIGTALANATTFTDATADPTLTYSYRVTAYNAAGSSTSAPLTVAPGLPSTTVVTSSLNPSFVGDSVTFTATVGPAAATGTVQFNIDGVDVGTPQTVVAGVATYTTSSLAAGTHPVTAVYGGDATYGSSTSAPITQTVSLLRATSTVVTSNRIPSANLGQSATFTATVSPVTGTGVPTGTVQFSIDGAGVGGAVTLSAAGTAIYSTATLPAGTHNVIAVYGGSAVFAGSASSAFTQVVIGPPAAPTNLFAAAVRTGATDRVTLTWVDNSNNETGFTVQRARNASFTLGLTTYPVAANTTTLVQNNVQRRMTYYYRIRATNGAGNSAWVNAIPFPVRTP